MTSTLPVVYYHTGMVADVANRAENMYKSVLLTDKEIALLRSVLGEYLSEKMTNQRVNLTIILNRLRQIKATKTYNQSID